MPPSQVSTPAAQEAWALFWRIFSADKPRRLAVMTELGLSFQQSMALMQLEPGQPVPMSALASALQCDNSNVTGIVDRLEAAGLAERRAGTPPPEIAALSEADAEKLREILQRALDG